MGKKKIKTFIAKVGAPFPKEKAQEVGTTLDRIRERNKGILLPSDVLENAKSPESKLHPYFDWKNTTAAGKWRKHQARLLINHVEVTYIYKKGEEHRPAFINIRNTSNESDKKDSPNTSRGYIDHITVGTNEEYRKQALQDALSQLIHWKSKYKWLNELNEVIKGIEQLEKKFSK